jgi:hypothetical protein
MRDAKLISSASGEAPIRPAIVAAFNMAALRYTQRLNYESILNRMVLSYNNTEIDEKTSRHHERLLKSVAAKEILEIIWRESLSDEELEHLGAERKFPKHGLNAHQLAKYLTENKAEVDRATAYIRTIAIAAADYRLVERQSLNRSMIILHATPLLCSLMETLGNEDLRVASTYTVNKLERERVPHHPSLP